MHVIIIIIIVHIVLRIIYQALCTAHHLAWTL